MLFHSGPASTLSPYRLLQNVPHPNTTVATITSSYSAPLFLTALSTYLSSSRPSSLFVLPNDSDRFDVYSQFLVHLPLNNAIDDNKALVRVRAIPGIPEKPGLVGRSDQFDTVFIHMEQGSTLTSVSKEDSYLSGEAFYTVYYPPHAATFWLAFVIIIPDIRVVRVKLIFCLPQWLSKVAKRLAYVNWFSLFWKKEKATGLYVISPSFQHHQPLAEVVPLERIVRGCHLIPKFGTKVSINRDMGFSKGSMFYVNPWIDMHMFYQMHNCSPD
jgi:hypothetical protein